MREEINYIELGNCIIPAFMDEINLRAPKEALSKTFHNTSRTLHDLLEEVVLLETLNFL